MENDPRLRRPSNPKGSPRSWSLKKSEAKALLAEGQWTLDPEHCDGVGDAYVSARGELLLFSNHGRSILYESRKAIVDALAESAKQPPPQHVLEGLLLQGPHFIEAVPGLVDELAKQLKLPREALDNTPESLDVVEEALKKRIRPRSRILEIPNLFAAIVAYTGEVARHVTGGHWHLNEVHGGIWEPYVMYDDDSDYVNPFLEPYKSIAERRRGGLLLRVLIPVPGHQGLKFKKADWE
ncbi:MAG: hypothetical protein IPM54_00645 [Polyangiaceae bacterium]|nr:hypothetical protein [Polyangiaceae bacterium]